MTFAELHELMTAGYSVMYADFFDLCANPLCEEDIIETAYPTTWEDIFDGGYDEDEILYLVQDGVVYFGTDYGDDE